MFSFAATFILTGIFDVHTALKKQKGFARGAQPSLNTPRLMQAQSPSIRFDIQLFDHRTPAIHFTLNELFKKRWG